MQQLQTTRNKAAVAWLHHDMRSLLHTLGGVSQAATETAGKDASVHQPILWRTHTRPGVVLRQPEFWETPLSASEIRHGIREGLIAVTGRVAVGVA